MVNFLVFDANLETNENPLNVHQTNACESVLITTALSEDEFITIAPGEGIQPLSILNDSHCEELAHPHLFPTGKFGYQVKRDVALSPVKYFNQRFLNYTQKFASDSDYIFFAHSVILKLYLNNQINIAMRKVASNSLTAGMLNRNFKEKVKEFIATDKAFSFMNCIKGTPAYWKKFLYEVLAMVKQLGVPTFFLTLSCADLRWDELISIISKLNNLNLTESDITNLSYLKRCNLLNSNPILVARHFQYRVEIFLKEIVINGPLGKTKYYVIRVEFQVRGSPHIHSFLWMVNAPSLTKSNKEEYIEYVDNIIHAILPDEMEEPKLYNLVKTYQLHRHSKTCRKYKNQVCRFHFGKFFSKRTIVAEPLASDIPEDERMMQLQKRKEILSKVKEYINTNLNPAKVNFFDHSRDDFVEVKSISEVLNELDIDELEYETALGISDDNDFQLHLRRPTNSCFVNNYFDIGLLAWEANMDIQPVFNHYKAITYMCSYLSKQEDECSQAMKQAVREAYESKLDSYQQMKTVAHAYATKRECSVQEAVYHIMPELWLRKIFPGVLYANSSLPEKRVKMILSEKEISELPEDSVDLYKRNMIDRYVDRPGHGIYEIVNQLCFSAFIKHYQLEPRPIENDCQPEELMDGVIEVNHELVGQYPKIIPLTNSKEKLKCRKVELVLRYHVPNRHRDPEAYAHHLLFMFYPFRVESELKSGDPLSYQSKLNEPGVIDIINHNKCAVEPFGDLVDDAFIRFRAESTPNMDSYGQQENDEIEQGLLENNRQSDSEEYEDNNPLLYPDSISSGNTSNILHDDDINAKIRSLNIKQRQIFDVVHGWAKDFMKNLSSKCPKKVFPFHLFPYRWWRLWKISFN